MFRSIFKPYGLVWNVCNTITDVLALSILWCACCLPVFTIGAATTALYDSAVRGIRFRQEGLYRRFFRTFRAELKTGTAVTLLWGAVLILGSYMLALLEQFGPEHTQAAMLAGAYRVLLTVPLAAACWSAAILSRFTFRFWELTGMSIRFLPAHLLSSAAIGALTWIVFRYCFEFPLALTFAPALTVLGWSLAAEPVFRKYGGGLQPEDAETPAEDAETPTD